MSKKFEDAIILAFQKQDVGDFRVNLERLHFFVCGGVVDATAQTPPSFRDRFYSHTACKHQRIHDSIIFAETFKDYFKENAYSDLFVFEEEIASISSLVIIFLESPGSLVELGMFCAKPDFYKKLVIVVPQEHIQTEDSFIFLGPLQNIRKKEPTSIAVYPWPDAGAAGYDVEHIEDLCEIVDQKISKMPNSLKFDNACSGHMAFLVAEIIRICFPILIGEIQLAVEALEIDITLSQLNRHIYLLEKLKIVSSYSYSSGYKYYYPTSDSLAWVAFGKARLFDVQKVRMSMHQAYALDDDSQSKKRRNALKQIKIIMKGVSQ